MATSHLKATALTNLDASPILEPNPGVGGPGIVRHVDGFVTALAADAATTTYQLARIPSNAIVKSVYFESEAQGAGKVQLGLYYSTSLKDGTAASNQLSTGLPNVVSGMAAFFSADIDCASAVRGEYVRGGGNVTLNTINLVQQPVWQAAGLATDPGGMLDVVATVHTTAVTTGTGRIYAGVTYTV